MYGVQYAHRSRKGSKEIEGINQGDLVSLVYKSVRLNQLLGLVRFESITSPSRFWFVSHPVDI
jgi:hypothetical protein